MLAGSHPSRYLNIDLGVLIASQAQSLVNPLRPLPSGIRLGNGQLRCASIKPVKMCAHFKRGPSIGSNHFIDRIAELESAVIDGYRRILPWKETPIDKCNVWHGLNPPS